VLSLIVVPWSPGKNPLAVQLNNNNNNNNNEEEVKRLGIVSVSSETTLHLESDTFRVCPGVLMLLLLLGCETFRKSMHSIRGQNALPKRRQHRPPPKTGLTSLINHRQNLNSD
jgi:hypothetical protein